jgi:cation diffusion facilitator family transporter
MDIIMNQNKEAIKTIYLSILGNVAMALLKGVTGYFGNSYALLADAIESVSDVFSSILVWFGLRYAGRPADKNHPYGHGKAEPLMTFVVVGLLVASATIIAYQSLQNIATPHALPEVFTLYVLGGIIVFKEVVYRIMMRKSKQLKSSSLKADAWHHRSDAITSLTAFVGISIALYFGEGYESADDWAALFASVIILYNSYLILRPALSEVMDEHVYDGMVEDIRNLALQVEGIKGTEKCHVRKAGLNYYVDLHAMVDGTISVTQGHDLAHRLKEHLQASIPQLADVLIHIEPDIS